jgi:hypothetical protein
VEDEVEADDGEEGDACPVVDVDPVAAGDGQEFVLARLLGGAAAPPKAVAVLQGQPEHEA